MLRSMFSGVSGLRSHQTMMDVVGNNIANVNTAGYKSSSVVFADTLSQMTKAAGAPQGGVGGTNPAQVGLGVRVDAISQNMGQGSAQATGNATDLMLSGDGMFVVQQGDTALYTRAGSFKLDSNGSIVTPDGAYVQGWRADKGNINTNAPIGNISIPADSVMPAEMTTGVTPSGNVDRTYKAGAAPTAATIFAAQAGEDGAVPYTGSPDPELLATDSTPPVDGKTYAVPGTAITSTFDAYNAQGVLTKVSVTFQNTVLYTKGSPSVKDSYAETNDWKVTAVANGVPLPVGATGGTDLAASIYVGDTGAGSETNPLFTTIPGMDSEIKIDLAKLTAYVGKSGTSNVIPTSDGAPIGTLTGFAFGTDGVITGSYSNGFKQTLGQVAIATFNNYSGLKKEGNSMFSVSTNSGNPVVGTAGTAGRGALLAGSLGMSNVDLSAEFTNLILAQRGFQANSKVITTSDDILQELVNLKR